MNARLLSIVAAAIMFVVCFSLMDWQRKKVTEQIREAETGVAAFHQGDFDDAIKKAKPKWEEASENWRKHQAGASFDAYHAVKSSLNGYLQNYSTKEVEPGVSLKAWFNKQEKAYQELVLQDLTWFFDALSHGDITPEDARKVIDGFSYHDFKEPEQRYKAELPRIEAARVKEARKWVRVILSDAAYQDKVYKAIREKWNARGGFKLVFSMALNSLEAEATAKTVRFEIDQHKQSYSIPTETNSIVIAIPDAVGVTFAVKGSAIVPTSWDKVEPISASVELPERITVRAKSGTLTEQTQQLIDSKQKELIDAFTARLKADFPAFEIFPGVDIAQLKLNKGNQLDRDAACALAYLDPERLQRELNDLLQTQNVRIRHDIVWIAIHLDLDYLANWVAKKIATTDPQFQAEMARELRLHPRYGDYEPLLAIINNSSSTPNEAVQALSGHFDEPKVQEVFLKKINNSRNYDRANYVSAYMQQASLDSAAQHATEWVTDRDERFATTAFIGLLNRDRKRATDVMFQTFDQVGEQTQAQMLHYFKFSPQEHGEKGLQLLVKLARKNNDVGRNARSVIRQSAELSPEAWEACLAMAGETTDPREKSQLEQELIWKSKRAHSPKAGAFLREKLDSDDLALRDAVIHQLLETDDPKDDVLRDLAKRVNEHPDDIQLVRQIIFSIHQYHTIRRNWNFGEEQTDMKTLLELGARHSDRQTRQSAYNIMSYAIKKGAKHYSPLLKAALEEEKDERLKQTFAKQIGA